jgi:hypothetical protein
VRRVSREFSVDLDHVVGTGKDGRVLKGECATVAAQPRRTLYSHASRRTGRRVLAATRTPLLELRNMDGCTRLYHALWPSIARSASDAEHSFSHTRVSARTHAHHARTHARTHARMLITHEHTSTRMHACAGTHADTLYTHSRKHTHTQTHTKIHTHVHTHAHHTHKHTPTHTRARAATRAHACMYTQTRTRTQTRAHTHTAALSSHTRSPSPTRTHAAQTRRTAILAEDVVAFVTARESGKIAAAPTPKAAAPAGKAAHAPAPVFVPVRRR